MALLYSRARSVFPAHLAGLFSAIPSIIHQRKYKVRDGQRRKPKLSGPHWDLLNDADLQNKDPVELLSTLDTMHAKRSFDIYTGKLGWTHFEENLEAERRDHEQRRRIYVRVFSGERKPSPTSNLSRFLHAIKLSEMGRIAHFNLRTIAGISINIGFLSCLLQALKNSPQHLHLSGFSVALAGDKRALGHHMGQLYVLSIIRSNIFDKDFVLGSRIIGYKARKVFRNYGESANSCFNLISNFLTPHESSTSISFHATRVLLQRFYHYSTRVTSSTKKGVYDYMAYMRRRYSLDAAGSLCMIFVQQFHDIKVIGKECSWVLNKWCNNNRNQSWLRWDQVWNLYNSTTKFQTSSKDLYRHALQEWIYVISYTLTRFSTLELETKELVARRYWARRFQLSNKFEEAETSVREKIQVLRAKRAIANLRRDRQTLRSHYKDRYPTPNVPQLPSLPLNRIPLPSRRATEPLPSPRRFSSSKRKHVQARFI